MGPGWRRYVSARGFASSSGYQTSVGLYRKDVTPPGGGEPGSDPQWLRTQLMERYNVKHVLLNGGSILGACALPDADFASAIAAAYNDWPSRSWLGEFNPDGAFKGSMFVAPQDPGQAPEIDRRRPPAHRAGDVRQRDHRPAGGKQYPRSTPRNAGAAGGHPPGGRGAQRSPVSRRPPAG